MFSARCSLLTLSAIGCGAVDRRRARELGRVLDQRRPVGGRVLQRAERTAALVVLEVDPVAGALALERDHARALLARLVAPDVGEPQLVAHAPAIAEVRGHPAPGGRPQPGDDGVQVVVRGRRPSGRISLRSIKDHEPRSARVIAV